MSFGKLSIQAAMEELDEAAAAEAAAVVETTEEVVEMPVDEETVEAAMAETAEVAAQVEGGGDSIEQAVGDAETLADVADTMEATEETGGMDEKAAAIAEVAIEALYERLHVSRGKAMPGLESFGSQSSRMKSTTIAVEAIRDDLKKVWAAIVAMASKVWEFVKGFFKSVFDTNTKLKEKAEKLLKAVASVDGAAEAGTLEEVKFAAQLSVGGKVTVEGVEAAVKDIQNAATVLAELFTDTAGVEEFIAGIDKPIKDKEVFDAFTDKSELAPGFKIDDAGKYGKAPEGCGVGISDELIGNRAAKLVFPATNEAGAKTWEALGNQSISFEVFDAKQKPVTSAPTLSAAEMTKVLNSVLETVASIEKLKPAFEKAQETTGKLVSASRKAMVMNIGEDKGAFARGRAVSRAVSKTTTLLTRPGTLFSKLMVDTSKAQLDWVVKSAAQYKGNKVALLTAPEKKEDGEAAAA